MGLELQQNVCWMVNVCVFACCLLLQASAGSEIMKLYVQLSVPGIRTPPSFSVAPALSPSGEQEGLGVGGPTSASQPNGTTPPPLPLLKPAPGPQLAENAAPPLLKSAPSSLQPYNSSPPQVTPTNVIPALPPSDPYKRPPHPEHPIHGQEGPVPVPSPSSQKSPGPGSMPPSSHQNKAPIYVPLAPEMNTPAPQTTRHNPPPTQVVNPVGPPSFLPEPVAPPPGNFRGTSQPVQPTLPKEAPPSSPGEHNASPVSTPPGIKPRRAGKRVAIRTNGTSNPHPSLSPTNAPPTQEGMGGLNAAPPPLPHPRRAPSTGLYSPASLPSTTIWMHPHSSNNMTAPGPPFNAASPHASTKEAPAYPKADRKTNLGHHASPPLVPAFRSPEGHNSSGSSPSPTSPPAQTKMPFPSPKVTTPQSLPRNKKMPLQALPPPPPNADCASLTCSDPLTNSPPGPLCVCVLPIQVELRLSVSLYTFFPLVSELAAEISAGVFMKQSQVRIMGANEASQDPEKTTVLINLVPLGESFDSTTAYLTFSRFWHKQVYIKASIFGNYEVLYVRYPGLPPSPPSANSDIGGIDGDSYNNPGNSAATLKPLGVDVSRMGHKNGPNKSVIAAVVLSASVAVILCCAVAWVTLFKRREKFSQPHRSPPTKIPSLVKSSAASMVGSGPSSVSLSYGSSVAAYTGSTKTFSSHEIERATDNFSEARVLGEGGFGRVFEGMLDDGTKVAVKILKREDDQGGREFLAEVEMLSRLHHRNLVKLIGICIEDRSRCLVYELVPNGSVESHLHGVDKETAPLDWPSRLKIALGAARGLAYLHEDSSPRVIHRDFKSSNILLDHDFMPKVSDFGLARTALDEKNTHISTRVMGTFGYVAPEYAMTGHLLVKSDVYSYGVVLLELLTGRKPVDMSQPPGQENLVSWARHLLTSEEGLALIVDQSLGPDFPFDSVTKVAAIASMCVEPEVSNRPFMGEVVQALKLVCNECDETKDLGSRRYSQEDLPVNTDARISSNSQHLPNPLCAESPISHYDCGLDLERGLSMSELLSSSVQYERPEYETHRRHSSSLPFRTKNTRQMWQKIRRLSTGSLSEHAMFRLWPESR